MQQVYTLDRDVHNDIDTVIVVTMVHLLEGLIL